MRHPNRALRAAATIWRPLLLPPTLLLLVWLCSVAQAAPAPDGWTATPLERFDREPFTARPLPAAGAALRLAKDARVAGNSARWEFTAGPSVAEIALRLPALPESCDGLGVWLKNPQQRALSVLLRLTDGAGAVWLSEPQVLETAPRWTRHFIALSDLTSERGGHPAGPFAAAELVVRGALVGQSHVVYLDELEALRAPLPEISVEGIQAPAAATAGESLRVRALLTGGVRAARSVDLRVMLEREGVPAAVARLSVTPEALGAAGTVGVEGEATLPRRLAGGTYRVRVTSSQAKLSGSPGREVQVTGAATGSFGVSHGVGGAGFTADGQALPIVGGWHTRRHPSRGASWVLVHLTADLTAGGAPLPLWTASEGYDFRRADDILAEVLAANPEAYLLPVISLEAPAWWKQAHPKDLMVFGNGKAELPATAPSFTRTHASWASKVWRQEAASFVARFVQHLEQGPLGPAVMGYQIASGEGGYWAYPGASYGVYADYSAPQQEAFREWLKRKYTDLQSLRVAWDQPARPVTTAEGLKESRAILGWSQARVPAQARRQHGSPTVLRDPETAKEGIAYGVLHDPVATQDVVDYQNFASDLVAETIQHFAQAIDGVTGARKVVGVSYGLLFDLAATPGGLQNGGHLALAPLSQSAALDFLVTPGTAGAAGGPPLVTIPAASLADHGKLWVGLAAEDRGLSAVALPLTSRGVVAQEGYTPERWPSQTVELLSRADRSSVSEIAVVVDDISAAYMGCGPELSKPLLSDQRVGLSLTGAPCDVWLLDDIISGRAPRYKLYIFLNAFYLDAKSRGQLVQTMNLEPCTALWVYAPGAADQTLGGRVMKDLTGLTLAQRPGRGPVKVRVDGEPGYTYGATQPFFPRFVCVDDQADIRGTLADTQYGGLAVKAYGQIRSVWSSAPHLPASLLRNIAVEAGVSLLADKGEGIYACGSLLAVRAAGAEQVVRLRQVCDIHELLSGRIVGNQVREFRPGIAPGEVKLYHISQPK